MTTSEVKVCTLPAAELSAYCEHLLRLDPRSRHARFGWAMDNNGIQTHCLQIAARGISVLVARVNNAVRAGIEIWPASKGSAEIVFSVEGDWRNRGLASSLISEAISEANRRNIPSLEMELDGFNPVVLHLIEKFGGSSHGCEGVRGKIATFPIKRRTMNERQSA
jgi:GNAT superfamily N-acetyltransferase